MKKELNKTQKKIFDAAVETFAEKGFNGASTSEIAKRAGVSEGSIFKYFNTKKGLLISILEYMIKLFDFNLLIGPVQKIFDNAEIVGVRETMRLLFRDRIELIEQNFPMVKMLVTEALYHDELREVLLEKAFEKIMMVLTGFCDTAISKGLIRADVTPEVLMRIAMGSLGALVVQRNILSKKINLKSLDEEIDVTVEFILAGIAP